VKTGSFILLTLLVAQCVPVSTYTNSDIASKSYFNDPQGRVQVFQNQQLKEYDLLNYDSYQTGVRQDPNFIPFSPYDYKYILDTLILRWEIQNPSISYNLSIQDIFDKQYAKLEVDMHAIIVSTTSFEKLSSSQESGLLFLSFHRTNSNNGLANSRIIALRPEEMQKRKNIRNKIKSIKTTQERVSTLVSLGYYLDALTLIELDLQEKENPDLASVYWTIVTELLTNTPPDLNR
jgi:hypothetical protein